MHLLPRPEPRARALAWLSWPLALMLSGCTHPLTVPMAPYVAPTSGPKARLLMRGAIEAGMSYTVVDFDGVDDCSRPKLVATGRPGADPAAVDVSANRIRTLAVAVVKPNNTVCQSRWTFMVRAGRSYVLTAHALPGGCEVSVLDATRPDAMQAEPSLRRRDAPGQACIPLAQTRTVAEINASAKQRSDGGMDLPIPASPAGAARPSGGVTEDDLKGLTK